MRKLIDIHTHLSCEDFEGFRSEALERALKVCDFIIDIGAGTSIDAFDRARAFAESHPRIYFTAGVHPHDAASIGSNLEARSRIEALVSHPKCVAVGECGLDYYYDNSPREAQLEVFKWQIDLAERYQLPLMIHTRDAEEDTKRMLLNYKGSAVFHCFTGTQDLANFGIQKNFIVSFSGIVTFKKAQALRDVFLNLPIENIVVETDAPFLAPEPLRGKKNEPSYVEHTAQFLAKLRGMDFGKFCDQTSRNALRIFSKINEPS